MRIPKAVFFGAFLVFFAAAGVSAPPATVSLTLKAEPVKYSGACPIEITFRGSITAAEPCTLAVRVVRSDHWKGEPRTVQFAKAGTQAFEYKMSWKESFKGWVALEAETAEAQRGVNLPKPKTFQSNTVELAIFCIPYDIRGTWTCDLLDTLSSPSNHMTYHMTFTGQTTASGMCTCPELDKIMPFGGTWRCGFAGATSVEYVAFDAQHRWVWSGQVTSATAMNGTMTEYDTVPNAPPVARPGGPWTGTKN